MNKYSKNSKIAVKKAGISNFRYIPTEDEPSEFEKFATGKLVVKGKKALKRKYDRRARNYERSDDFTYNQWLHSDRAYNLKPTKDRGNLKIDAIKLAKDVILAIEEEKSFKKAEVERICAEIESCWSDKEKVDNYFFSFPEQKKAEIDYEYKMNEIFYSMLKEYVKSFNGDDFMLLESLYAI